MFYETAKKTPELSFRLNEMMVYPNQDFPDQHLQRGEGIEKKMPVQLAFKGLKPSPKGPPLQGFHFEFIALFLKDQSDQKTQPALFLSRNMCETAKSTLKASEKSTEW